MKLNRDIQALNIQAFIKYILITALAIVGYVTIKPNLTLIALIYMLVDITTLVIAMIVVKRKER